MAKGKSQKAELKATMSQKELEVEVARAKLDAAKARAVRAEKEWKRIQPLIPQNAIPISDAEQIECNYEVAQAELREAAAKLKIAELGSNAVE